MRLLLTGCLLAASLLTACSSTQTNTIKGAQRVVDAYNVENPIVKPGIEVLLENPEYFRHIRGKRVGLITNPTGVDSRLRSTIDLLHEHPEVELVRLFGPEHGVRGDAYAGEKVEDAVDKATGIQERSLYGKTRRPPAEYLEGIDVMVYDIQDVGSRSYTYIYTMAYCMEECGKRGIPFIVLDRPNPCGDTVSGNILNQKEYSTFVGLYAIPYQYGMTPGEVAGLFNERFNSVKCDLTVVPMEGYRRDMMQWDTGLAFVPSSPHIPSAKHAVYYNLTGIIGEIPHIQIGVGYTMPFETVAAPWIDSNEFADALRAKNLPGLLFRPITYKPFYSRFKDEPVHGVHIIISDYHKVQPVEAQIHIMEVIQRLYPESALFTDEKAKKSLFDEVNGTDEIRARILKGDSAEAIIADYKPAVAEFEKVRQQYLIYK